MNNYRRCALLFLCLIIFFPVITTAKQAVTQNLKTDAVNLDKPDEIISERTRSYLTDQAESEVLIWVFFTDKGVFDKNSFALAASSVTITDHARARRAKAGVTGVVYADLPVVPDYIGQIEALGAQNRRSSRWLNAASFRVSPSQLDAIAALPFVYNIRPVAKFTGSKVTDGTKPSLDNTALEAYALDYGYSLGQLEMINVPTVHDLGYDGSGVIVCMMDTGCRKSHEAFDTLRAEGRLLNEYDFIFDDNNVQNEPGDAASQQNHGTYTFSTLGGYSPGTLIGPAYGASFLLAKTEDTRSETPVEEDNWVAALEWADIQGVDVTSTSLGYSDWYTQEDYNGKTAVISIAAGTSASLGIVTVTSAGNEGPAATTITAPADAFDIVSVGAVSSSEIIASFSSRGPSSDGRIKPEVCAQGIGTFCADAVSDNAYTTKNGTSLSCPLIGGAAALMVQARPDLSPWQIREALMKSGNFSSDPNNNYGWGIIDLATAINFTDVCGDVNDDNFCDISDFAYLTNYLYGNGPRITFHESADVDSIMGVNNNDVQYLANYLYNSGPAPHCLPAPQVDPSITDDSVFISGTVIMPGETTDKVDITLKSLSSISGLAMPIFYSCSTATISIDSISFAGSMYEHYNSKFKKYYPFDHKAVIAFVNRGESIPAAGEGLLASVWFSIETSAVPHEILIDTTDIDNTSPLIFSRMNPNLEPFIPAFSGLGKFYDPVIHVATWGSDETGDGNFFNPYATIQKAVDTAQEFDTILVADGMYTGIGNRDVVVNGKNLVILSENGPTSTIIDCEDMSRGFYFVAGLDTTTLLDGFTVMNGNNVVGGGIACDQSSPTIRNCVLYNNTGWGAGMFVTNGKPILKNLTIANNTSSQNNEGGGIFLLQSPEARLENCIIAFNQGSGIHFLSQAAPSPMSCCDIFGNTGGEFTGLSASIFGVNGNFSLNPFFCDTLSYNYGIRTTSPCAPDVYGCSELIGALPPDPSCHGCCIGVAGNANCSEDEMPDVSDISRIIGYLYLDKNPLCCMEEADVDGNFGEPDISDIVRLIDYLYINHTPPADCK